MEIHEKKLKGENNETLKVELERTITRGKLQILDDLSDTKKNYIILKKKQKGSKKEEMIQHVHYVQKYRTKLNLIIKKRYVIG